MSPDLELLLQYRDTRRCELFEAIVAHHGPMVFRAALRVLRDHHEAEDVVQLTFIELAKHPEAAGPHLIGWLHRTATNAATDLVRSRARRARREDVKGRASGATRRDDPEELREEIDAALDRLPADLREAVILRHLEGRDYGEAARLAGCSEDALRKRSQRGLLRLRDHLSARGIVCGLEVLTAFLAGESAANAAVPTTLLENLSRVCTGPPEGQSAATAPRAALKGVFGTKVKVVTVAAVLAGGTLGLLGAHSLARRWAAPAVAGPVPGWSADVRARFRALPLEEAATVSSARPIFSRENGGNDVLLLPRWGEFTVRGIPFRVADPRDGAVRNLVVLRSPLGDYGRRLPESASLRCGLPARAIHLLSGVSGWGYPVEKGHTVSMVVRLRYAGGSEEAHYLLNGAHFASYADHDEVPGSAPALHLEHGHQMRYLAITPSRSEAIERIEFLKGDDPTGPIVMAVTVEVAGRAGAAGAALVR